MLFPLFLLCAFSALKRIFALKKKETAITPNAQIETQSQPSQHLHPIWDRIAESSTIRIEKLLILFHKDMNVDESLVFASEVENLESTLSNLVSYLNSQNAMSDRGTLVKTVYDEIMSIKEKVYSKNEQIKSSIEKEITELEGNVANYQKASELSDLEAHKANMMKNLEILVPTFNYFNEKPKKPWYFVKLRRLVLEGMDDCEAITDLIKLQSELPSVPGHAVQQIREQIGQNVPSLYSEPI